MRSDFERLGVMGRGQRQITFWTSCMRKACLGWIEAVADEVVGLLQIRCGFVAAVGLG